MITELMTSYGHYGPLRQAKQNRCHVPYRKP